MISFFDRFKPTDQQKAINGHGASASLCCTTLSLDEATNAAQSSGDQLSGNAADTSLVHLPHTAGEAVLTAGVGYMAAGGALIGAKIFREFAGKQKGIKGAREQLKSVTGTNPSKAEAFNKKAYDAYLKREHRDAGFQKWSAGAASGVGSGLVAGGLFFNPLAAAGLGVLSGVGVSHVGHTRRQLNETKASVHRTLKSSASDKHVREYVFNRKASHLKKNLVGWTAFSAGTGILSASSIATMAAGVVFPPALLLSGVGTLVGGVAATSIHNNILNGHRFGASLPGEIKQTLSHPLSHNQVQQHNLDAYNMRNVTKSYRRDLFNKQKVLGSNTIAKTTRTILRSTQKTLAILSLGLVPKITHGMKHTIKATTMNWKAPDNHAERVKTLHRLANKEAVEIPTHQQKASDRLDQLVSALSESGVAPVVMENFVQSVCKTGRKSYNQGQKKWEHEVVFKKSHMDLFHHEDDQKTFLAAVVKPAASACCTSHGSTQTLETLQELINKNKSDEEFEEFAARVLQALEKSVDFSLVYTLRKQAKTDMYTWSSLSDSFEKTAEKFPYLKDTEKEAEPVINPVISHHHEHEHAHAQCSHTH